MCWLAVHCFIHVAIYPRPRSLQPLISCSKLWIILLNHRYATNKAQKVPHQIWQSKYVTTHVTSYGCHLRALISIYTIILMGDFLCTCQVPHHGSKLPNQQHSWRENDRVWDFRQKRSTHRAQQVGLTERRDTFRSFLKPDCSFKLLATTDTYLTQFEISLLRAIAIKMRRTMGKLIHTCIIAIATHPD